MVASECRAVMSDLFGLAVRVPFMFAFWRSWAFRQGWVLGISLLWVRDPVLRRVSADGPGLLRACALPVDRPFRPTFLMARPVSRRSWGGLYPFAGSPGGGRCGAAMPENTAQRGADGVLDEAHPATLVSVSPAARAFM